MVGNYRFRNWVKEQVCRIYDTADYAANHPYTTLRREAHASTVEFIKRVCPRAIAVRTPKQLMAMSIDCASDDGVFAEFGVSKGESLRFIATSVPGQAVHGFDSFEGLPEAWVNNDKGAFSAQGKLPSVPSNVRLWVGLFDETLPKWRAECTEPIALLHVDCDLRSATETVMEGVRDRMRPGSIMVFDDYFNFPGWEDDGHAVLEMIKARENWNVEYIGYSYKELAVRLA